MRRAILTILGLFLLATVPAAAQEQKEDSVAEAARKAREKKKQAQAPKATKVFTNDNMPAGSGAGSVSVVGATQAPPPESGDKTSKADKGAAGDKEEPSEEAIWLKRFAEIRTKIRQAEKEIDILQREFNLVQQQYYSDPNQALREQLERKEIGERRKKIEDKQAEIKQLQQQLVDLEEELRKAGGPAGWARES